MVKSARDNVKEMVEKYIPKASDDKKKLLEEALYKIQVEKKTPMEAFGLTQDELEIIYKEAYNIFQAGKYKEAIEYFTYLRSIKPDDYRFNFAIAAAYHYQKQYSFAIANYGYCTLIDPLNPIPRFHQYDCFMKINEPLAAYRAIKEAIFCAELDPKYEMLKEKALLEEKFLTDYLTTYFKEQAVQQTTK